jgi:hypothetical protein
MRIRDLGWKKLGSGMEKIRIRDPEWKKFGYGMENGSGINIPDPKPWYNAKW